MSDIVMQPELKTAICRNTYLHSLLSKDLSEPLSADQIDTIEILHLEILANTARMMAMLKDD
jgi:hypothetical protein